MNELIAGTIAAPKDLPADAVGSVGTPNTLPADSAGIVGTPNTVPSDSAGIIAAPISLPSQGAAALPRSLTPMVEFDFAAKRYVQDGVAVAFEDIFNYTRASSATFTNRRLKKNGGYEYFLDTDYVGSVENLITYSEDFSDADWSKSGVSVTGNAAIAPDGTLTADKLIEDSANTQKQINSADFGADTYGNFSCYAKSAENNYVQLSGVKTVSDYVNFDVKNGVITAIGSGVKNAKIINVGGGWFKCSAQLSLNATGAYVYLINSATQGWNTAYQGDGVSGIYVWGAQLTVSAKALPYVKTLDVAVTKTFAETLRTEYDAVTGKNLGALIEGASTNLCAYSESMGATGWATGSQDTVLQNVKKAPDDTLSMNSIKSGATVGSSYVRRDLGLTAGVTYTVSVYASSNDTFTTGNIIKVTSPNDGQLGNVTLVAAQLTDKVKRYSVTFQVLTTQTHYFYFAVDADANKTIEVWGAQIEALPFASSYIRTEGSAVSRSSDGLSIGADNISDQDSTFNINFKVLGANTTFQKIFSHTGNFGYYSLYTPPSGYVIQSTIGASSSGGYKTTSANEHNKITGVYSFLNGTFSGYSENEIVFTNSISTFTKNPANRVFIGASGPTTQFTFGHISKFSTYAQALTAQEITLL